MISVNNFKTGQTIKLNNEIYQVIEFQHVKPGKGPAFVRSKLKNLRTKATIDHTFNAGISVEPAHIEKKDMQFLYDEGTSLVFMDKESFEQISIDKDIIKDEMLFLKEEMVVSLITFENEIIGLDLPNKVELVVSDTEPNIKGDTKSGSSKKATLETGLIINVPLFIEKGEKIIINTETKEYVSKVKE